MEYLLEKHPETISQLAELAKSINKNALPRQISIERIRKVLCYHYNVNDSIFEQRKRKRDKVQIRQTAHKLAKELTNLSFHFIGREIGMQDHATVMHSCKTIDNLIETDKKFRAEYETILKKIKS